MMTSYAAPVTYTTTAPAAISGIDVNRDGKADYIVMGSDVNRDGIPDALEQPAVTTTYVTQAPAVSYQPTYTLPTSSSMVAYPQSGPFVFYAEAPAEGTKKKADVTVARKKPAKKPGCCARLSPCCAPKKA